MERLIKLYRPGPILPPAVLRAAADLADIARRLGRYFVRSQSRQRVMAYVHGLLSEAERKNSWQVAEACGDPTRLPSRNRLARADRDADLVRDGNPHQHHPHWAIRTVCWSLTNGLCERGATRPG